MQNTHLEPGIDIPDGRALCQQCMGRRIDVTNPGSNYKSWKFFQCPFCHGLKHIKKNDPI